MQQREYKLKLKNKKISLDKQHNELLELMIANEENAIKLFKDNLLLEPKEIYPFVVALELANSKKIDLCIKVLNTLRLIDYQNKSIVNKTLLNILYNEKRYKQLESTCNILLKKYPDNIDFLNMRGTAKVFQDRIKAGYNDFTKILSLNPNHIATLRGRVGTLITLKKYSDALQDINRIFEIQPKAVDYRSRGLITLSLASIEYGEKNIPINILEQSWKDINECIKLISNISDIKWRADISFLLKEYQVAIEDCDYCIKKLANKRRYPNRKQLLMQLYHLKAESQYELGKCKFALENINKAIEMLEVLKPEYESDGRLFFIRGKIYQYLYKKENKSILLISAEKDIKTALDYEPNNHEYLNYQQTIKGKGRYDYKKLSDSKFEYFNYFDKKIASKYFNTIKNKYAGKTHFNEIWEHKDFKSAKDQVKSLQDENHKLKNQLMKIQDKVDKQNKDIKRLTILHDDELKTQEDDLQQQMGKKINNIVKKITHSYNERLGWLVTYPELIKIKLEKLIEKEIITDNGIEDIFGDFELEYQDLLQSANNLKIMYCGLNEIDLVEMKLQEIIDIITNNKSIDRRLKIIIEDNNNICNVRSTKEIFEEIVAIICSNATKHNKDKELINLRFVFVIEKIKGNKHLIMKYYNDGEYAEVKYPIGKTNDQRVGLKCLSDMVETMGGNVKPLSKKDIEDISNPPFGFKIDIPIV